LFFYPVKAVSVKSGDTVVVSAAAGGVGSVAVQLAKNAGAKVIGLSSEANHKWLSDHGVISDALLLPAPAYPVLLVIRPTIPSLWLIAGGPAKAIDHGENDPAVVPDAMRVSQSLVEISMRGKAHQVKRVPKI
jgi:hypothetical protein